MANAATVDLIDWIVTDQGLMRSFSFETFEQAFAFVNRMKAICDQTDHYPKIEIDDSAVSVTIKATDGHLTKSAFELADLIYSDGDRFVRFLRGNTLLSLKDQPSAPIAEASDQEVKDALRISGAWFALCRKGSKCEFTEEEVIALHVAAATELIHRDMLLLLPEKSAQQELFVMTVKQLPSDSVLQLDNLLHQRFGKRHTKERLQKTHEIVAQELSNRALKIPVEHDLGKSDDHLDLVGWHLRLHELAKHDPEPLIDEHDQIVQRMETEGLWHDTEDLLDVIWLEKQRRSTTVQTLIFDKKIFNTREAAVRWARSHGFRSDKVDETENSFRLRQRDPGDFQEGSFRTISLRAGVQVVIGRLKERGTNGRTA